MCIFSSLSDFTEFSGWGLQLFPGKVVITKVKLCIFYKQDSVPRSTALCTGWWLRFPLISELLWYIYTLAVHSHFYHQLCWVLYVPLQHLWCNHTISVLLTLILSYTILKKTLISWSVHSVRKRDYNTKGFTRWSGNGQTASGLVDHICLQLGLINISQASFTVYLWRPITQNTNQIHGWWGLWIN